MSGKTKTTEINLQQMLEWLDGFQESAEPPPDERSIEIAKAIRQRLMKNRPTKLTRSAASKKAWIAKKAKYGLSGRRDPNWQQKVSHPKRGRVYEGRSYLPLGEIDDDLDQLERS